MLDAVKALGLDVEKIKTQLEIKASAMKEEEARLKVVKKSIKDVSALASALPSPGLKLLPSF